MRITTTEDDLKAAIVAELSLDLDESAAGTYAHNIVRRLMEIAQPAKTSDITGFPEDDDWRRDADAFERMAKSSRVKVPGFPGIEQK
jgi:hypothetical protein